jgi:hypothetical protein
MLNLYKNKNTETIQIEEAIELMKQNSIKIENERIKIKPNKVFNIKYLQNNQEIDICSIVGGILKVN